MKKTLLIISFFLSFILSGGSRTGGEQISKCSSAVVEAAEEKPSDKNPNSFSQAILPVQSARVTGESSSITASVRSTNTGRRTQVSHKYPFRIIKAGKIIDRNHFYIFLTELHQFQTGIHSTSRYIYTICHLLI